MSRPTACSLHGYLASAAERFPGRTALADDSRAFTYAEWLAGSRAVACSLLASGIREGDTLAYAGAKSAWLPVHFLAASMLGCRFLSVSPSWPGAVARRIARIAGRTFVACDEAPPQAWSGFPALPASSLPVPAGDVELPDPAPSSVVYLNVTSASTGMPKIVATTSEQLLANTRGISAALGLAGSDVHMSLFSSVGHPHELFARALLLGGTSVLTATRYPREALDLIERHGVTFLMGLPPQLEGLARVAGRRGAGLGTLRIIEAGGMHISSDFLSLFRSLTSIDVTPVWGSTETSGVALVGAPGTEGFSSVVEGYEAELIDSSGDRIEGDGEGELRFRGDAVAERYLGDRVSTAESFSSGWFRTGDVFRRSSGRLLFVGRRGGLVKSAGLKVYPLEVELALLRHPDVSDAVVAGEVHSSRGETVAAWVVPRPGCEPSPASLRSFLRGFLDDYKIPRTFRMVPDLPRTPGGKVDRAALGRPPAGTEWRSDLLRTDIEIVKLINHRAALTGAVSDPYDPDWVEEQLDSAVGHNPGPVSDDAVREMLAFMIETISRR